MMIILNGKTHEIAPDTPLAELVERLNLGRQRYAVEVNEEVVPRSQHASLRLREGDRVEIVRAIGGG